MYLFLQKYIFRFPAVILFFILVQTIIYFSGIIQPSVDFKEVYWMNANNLLDETHSFSSADAKYSYHPDGQLHRFGHMPPVYTLVIAGLLQMGGSQSSVYIFNVLILLLTLWVTKKLYELITPNRLVTYISLYILCVYPLFAILPATFGAESLFCFLLMGGCYFFIKTYQNPSYLTLLALLISLALATETKLMSLYMIPLLAIPLFMKKQPIHLIAISTIFILLTFICLYSFNQSPVNEYYLQRTAMDGLDRHGSNLAAIDIMNQSHVIKKDFTLHFAPILAQSFMHEPVAFIQLYMMKFCESWYKTDQQKFDFYILLLQLGFFLAYIYQLLMNLFSKERNATILMLLGVIVYFNLTAMVTFSICRYMAAVSPLVVVVLVYTVNGFRKRDVV